MELYFSVQNQVLSGLGGLAFIHRIFFIFPYFAILWAENLHVYIYGRDLKFIYSFKTYDFYGKLSNDLKFFSFPTIFKTR